jgi:hypothetical protein
VRPRAVHEVRAGPARPQAATRLAQRYAALDPVHLKLALEAAQASRYDEAARSDALARPR